MKFSPEFFREENRDDFTVPEMMKRAWAAELEVLKVIENVCQRNGLRYYAYCGTLLGCVRHKGFIPWDDDIDICMLREDYDRFFEIADKELPEGFVVSGIYGSEPRLWQANGEPQGRVMADEKYFSLPKYMDRFHAFPYMRIGVDIFPLDSMPSDPAEQYELVRLLTEMQTVARYADVYRKNGTLRNRVKAFEQQLEGFEYEYDYGDNESLSHAIWLASDRLAASVNESEDIADILYRTLPADKASFTGYTNMKRSWFGEGIEMPFESTVIRVPINYTDVLAWEFGKDYMTPVRFTGEHTYPFYKTQEKAFIELLKEAGVESPVDEFCRNWHSMSGYT